MSTHGQLMAGAVSSKIVENCQVCGAANLRPVLFLGFLPPVNEMREIGAPLGEQPAYPAQLLFCPCCQLAQLGLIVDKSILFPPGYPYTSGTTKILHDDFAEMQREAQELFRLGPEDLVIDVGSNDGTLLSKFKAGGHRVYGIEPSDTGRIAQRNDIPTAIAFFGPEVARNVRAAQGPASVVTATNVFAHIEDVHTVVQSILLMLRDDGVFISESHYFIGLLETLQYDTIYHEHLRYYSLRSLQYLLDMNGLEAIHAKRIPTHGGSIRVYAARKGTHAPRPSVARILEDERNFGIDEKALASFRERVTASKLDLYALLWKIKKNGARVYGVGAPSRASTLINYAGLDDGILDCVLEVKNSLKLGKYMPGTVIPVLDESRLYADQPEYALLLSWHIADELIPKLKQKGYRGKFIVPLPAPLVRD
jgi:SAM-dependent methyltransferase